MVIAFEVTWQQISTTPICRRQAGFRFRQKGMGWVEGGVRVSQQPPNRPESPSLASMLDSQGLARFSKQHTKELYLYSFFKKIECANWFMQDFSSSATICVLFFFWVCVNVLSFLPLLTYIPHLRFPPSLFLPAKTHRSRSYFFSGASMAHWWHLAWADFPREWGIFEIKTPDSSHLLFGFVPHWRRTQPLGLFLKNIWAPDLFVLIVVIDGSQTITSPSFPSIFLRKCSAIFQSRFKTPFQIMYPRYFILSENWDLRKGSPC